MRPRCSTSTQIALEGLRVPIAAAGAAVAVKDEAVQAPLHGAQAR